MSNFLSTNLKKLALLTNANLDEVSISNLESEIASISDINLNTLSYAKNIELYKFFIKTLNNVSKTQDNETKLNNILEIIEDKFEYINKKIRISLYEKVKSARLLNDYTIQKQTLAFDIDINPQTFKTMTGAIIDSTIFAIKSKDNGMQKSIDTEIVKNIQVEGNNGLSSIGGTILKKVTNGWVVANKEEIIKEEGMYLAKTQSIYDGENDITLSINFGKVTNVEAITPVFKNAEVVKIYTSKNDKDFNLIAYKIATKNKTFVLEDKNIKNIKIVINKKDASYKLGNTYIYECPLSQIKISSDYEKEDVIFETKSIIVNAALSKIAITTKDNYDSNDVDIKYYISINEKDYEEIRPSGKIKNKDISSIVSIENETENKLLKLENSTRINNKFVYDLPLPQPFVMTNNLRIFTNLNLWEYKEGLYECYIFNYEEKTINIGNKFIFINGEKHSGAIKIKKGINKIQIPKEFFVNLFNKSLCKKYTINGSIITVTLNNGNEITINDSMYPYNIKLLIEENSDFVFQEIQEKINFNFKLNENNELKIERIDGNKEIYCVYKNLYKNTQNIKLKGILKSKNNKTIPKIERITVRAE